MLLICSIKFSSCKKFLEIDPPVSSLEQSVVFKNDGQAISAVTGVYALMSNGYASGGASITLYAGASSDEFIGYSSFIVPFYENQLVPELTPMVSLYSGPYRSIYTANSILEGLARSSGVTPPVKAQLEGEALFIRAFAYFYLTNMFGEVPLQLTSDYRVTSAASKASVSTIYQQIITDLQSAENLLIDAYPTIGRVRPNKSTAQALLARTFLYIHDWKNAEKYATLVINKTNAYSLVGLDAVFLANSQETIWQLMPNANTNSQEGALFILAATPIYVSLRNDFVANAFEAGDKRKIAWIGTYTNTTGTYYYPFKYKVRSSTTVSEYSMVLRLAEQFLIRAEARINQEKIDIGITDLNVVRQRPLPGGTNANSIPPISTTLDKASALLAIEKERRVELFSEWGHRWFDLKRTGNSERILRVIKPLWQSTDLLYPIPIDEINRNRNVTQNDGY